MSYPLSWKPIDAIMLGKTMYFRKANGEVTIAGVAHPGNTQITSLFFILTQDAASELRYQPYFKTLHPLPIAGAILQVASDWSLDESSVPALPPPPQITAPWAPIVPSTSNPWGNIKMVTGYVKSATNGTVLGRITEHNYFVPIRGTAQTFTWEKPDISLVTWEGGYPIDPVIYQSCRLAPNVSFSQAFDLATAQPDGSWTIKILWWADPPAATGYQVYQWGEGLVISPTNNFGIIGIVCYNIKQAPAAVDKNHYDYIFCWCDINGNVTAELNQSGATIPEGCLILATDQPIPKNITNMYNFFGFGKNSPFGKGPSSKSNDDLSSFSDDPWLLAAAGASFYLMWKSLED